MIKIKYFLLYIFFFGALLNTVYSTDFDLCLLNNPNQKIDLNEFTSVFIDSSNTYSIDDIILKKEHLNFKKYNILDFGYQPYTFWLKIDLADSTNLFSSLNPVVIFNFPNIHHIKFYQVSSQDSILKKVETGKLSSFESRDIPSLHFGFKLVESPLSTSTLYFKINTKASQSFGLTMLALEKHRDLNLAKLLFMGIFCGFLLSIVIYYLGHYFSVKDLSLLYFSLLAFNLFMWAFSFYGLSDFFLLKKFVSYDFYAIPLFQTLIILSLLLFFNTFLNLKENLKIGYYSNIFFIALLVLDFLIYIVLFENYSTFMVIHSFSLLFVFLFTIITTIIVWKRGYKLARYITIPFVILSVYMVHRLLVRLGLLESSTLGESALFFAPVLIYAFFAKAISDKIGQIKKEKIQTAEALSESLERYRQISEHINDTYFELALDGTIIEISSSFEKGSTYTRDQVVNQKFDLFFKDPEFLSGIFNNLLSDKVVHDVEAETNEADGGEGWININAFLQQDEHGNPVKIIGSYRDIKEKKLLEEQLKQSQKLEAIGTLAGGIAHDFNNLLTVINGYAEILLSRFSNDTREFSQVKAIQQAGEKAQNLTRQILAFSRKQVFKPQIIDLNKTLVHLEKMLKRLIGEDVEFLCKYDDTIPFILADAAQIEQIVLNLVVNARDAVQGDDQKEKLITLKTRNVVLSEELNLHKTSVKKGHYVVISVSDTGMGIPQNVIDKIFEPFFTTKESGKGTGLGLSTVYGIVKQNEAQISIDSKIGKGTEFKIYWPVVEKELEIDIKMEEEEIQMGSEHILFVEDEVEILSLAKTQLENYGYKVQTARNGNQALQIYKNSTDKFDLLITDLVMPGMNGKELYTQIASPDLKVLYISGYADSIISHQGEIDDVNIEFLEKPFNTKTLLDKVKKILDEN